jgi:predicted dehydrogenase
VLLPLHLFILETKMVDPVRIGFIGLGSVSSKYLRLAEQLRYRGLVELFVGCDTNTARKEAIADKYGIKHFTTSYEDVLNNPDVDLVLVMTPMPLHGKIARAALEAGKHVLVEKPMSVNLDEAAALVELAKTSPGYLVPAPHILLSPTYQTIWKRVHSGDVGKVLLARAMYGWAGPWWGPWFYEPGGGALFDLGVYNVTSLTGLLGPAKRVTAMAGVAIPERVVDGKLMPVNAVDNAHILLDFGDNVFAVVTTGFTIQQYRCPAIELYGTTGTIQMMGDDWDPEGYELWQNGTDAWQIFAETNPEWPWVDGLRHFVECIQNKTRPIITPEHAYHALEIMLKAEESGRDGQAKMINSTFTPPVLAEIDKQDSAPAHLVHDPT